MANIWSANGYLFLAAWLNRLSWLGLSVLALTPDSACDSQALHTALVSLSCGSGLYAVFTVILRTISILMNCCTFKGFGLCLCGIVDELVSPQVSSIDVVL